MLRQRIILVFFTRRDLGPFILQPVTDVFDEPNDGENDLSEKRAILDQSPSPTLPYCELQIVWWSTFLSPASRICLLFE